MKKIFFCLIFALFHFGCEKWNYDKGDCEGYWSGEYCDELDSFVKEYGDSSIDEFVNDMAFCKDGGLILCGHTGNEELFLLKTDENGVREWSWSDSTSLTGNVEGRAVVESDDGGFLVCGTIDGRILVLKVDENGNYYCHDDVLVVGVENGYDIIKTSDGNYVIAGVIGLAKSKIDIRKIDAFCNTIWSKEINDPEYNLLAPSVIETNVDSGLLISGFARGDDKRLIYLVKTDKNGEITKKTSIAELDYAEGGAVVQAQDEGFVITGSDSDKKKIFLLKVDSNLGFKWKEFYDTELLNSHSRSIVANKNNDGFTITGYVSGSDDKTSREILLLKTDNKGELVWMKTPKAHSGKSAKGCAILQDLEGSYYIGGYTTTPDDDLDKAFLMKTTSEGEINGPKS